LIAKSTRLLKTNPEREKQRVDESHNNVFTANVAFEAKGGEKMTHAPAGGRNEVTPF
jgi:hypothetical protein